MDHVPDSFLRVRNVELREETLRKHGLQSSSVSVNLLETTCFWKWTGTSPASLDLPVAVTLAT